MRSPGAGAARAGEPPQDPTREPSSPTTSSARRASRRTRSSSRHCQGGRSMLSTKPDRERTWAPTAALSSTSSSLSGRVVWKTVASPRRALRCGGHRVTSRPATRTVPSSTAWNPETHPSSVDLPAPFGPMRQVSEPSAIPSETSSTAATAPNAFVTPESSHTSCAPGSTATGADAAPTDSGYLKQFAVASQESRRRGCELPP